MGAKPRLLDVGRDLYPAALVVLGPCLRFLIPPFPVGTR